MTQVWQLLTIVAAVGIVVIYGIVRDKQEYPPKDSKQQSIYFPEHEHGEDERDRGAAMSHLP